MKLFEEEYRKCLKELKAKLSQETDSDKYQQILSDISYIQSYLLSYKNSNFVFVAKSFKEKKELLGSHQLQQLKKCKMSYFKTNHINKEKKEILEKLTEEFVNLETLKLKDVYNRIKDYNGIGYEYEYAVDKAFAGATVYIRSLDKNYIKIFLINGLSDFSTRVHELGHARANTMCKNVENKQKFIEVYPTFLELIFADYLKIKGMQKDSYNLKLSMLKRIRNFLDEINEEIYEYIYRDSSKNKVDDYIFEYKYKVVKDAILAFKVYDMYLSNPKEILEKIDLFITNLQIMSEEELLKIFGLESSVFEENIVFYKVFEQLKQEKKQINASLSRIKLK